MPIHPGSLHNAPCNGRAEDSSTLPEQMILECTTRRGKEDLHVLSHRSHLRNRVSPTTYIFETHGGPGE